MSHFRFRSPSSVRRALESKMTSKEFEDYPCEEGHGSEDMVESQKHGERKPVSVLCSSFFVFSSTCV